MDMYIKIETYAHSVPYIYFSKNILCYTIGVWSYREGDLSVLSCKYQMMYSVYTKGKVIYVAH